jgi:hypothetical protein
MKLIRTPIPIQTKRVDLHFGDDVFELISCFNVHIFCAEVQLEQIDQPFSLDLWKLKNLSAANIIEFLSHSFVRGQVKKSCRMKRNTSYIKGSATSFLRSPNMRRWISLGLNNAQRAPN